MPVSVKERLITIQLMEKVNANLTYEKMLDIVVVQAPAKSKRQTTSNSANKKL